MYIYVYMWGAAAFCSDKREVMMGDHSYRSTRNRKYIHIYKYIERERDRERERESVSKSLLPEGI